MVPRVGLGYDIHPFGTEGTLVLGGVRFDGEPALVGHSDGDAVAHAVADALLGAAAMGDLGTLFPADDETYRGADSMDLLRDVVARVTDSFQIGNVDVVVAAERPRLAPVLGEMSENLARAVGAQVTVKPKFGEGIGEIGRGEAIAVWAIALMGR
ncbi:MAG: 2-C-methyl-D-erythritol 2,4-cyclodiphosphate synthase [Actinobacteria bacterium]|nr:2-C-methyl-D-erythritol 2,4-cyclodiphosphate synthase [Actinomycetota bacterium]